MRIITILTALLLCLQLPAQNNAERVNIEKVFVQGGSFLQGSSNKDRYRDDDEQQHTVMLNDFYIGKTEVTIAQYILFMNEEEINSDGSKNGVEYIDMNDEDCVISYEGGKFMFKANYSILNGNYALVEVTWAGAQAFCKWTGGRLPTEAEWEYAARGGSKSKGYTWAGSDTTRQVAVYRGTAKRQPKPIMYLKPNELGIYDMSGGVHEWCSDWYGPYNVGSVNNPKGPKKGEFKVIRGGSWNCYAEDCRVAYRGNRNPQASGVDCGFRVVFD